MQLLPLWQVPHLGSAIALVSIEAVFGRDEVATLEAPLHEIDIPGLVQDILVPTGAL